MTNITKLLVMMMCFWIMKVGSCKTPWSDRGRQLYLRTAEELAEARSELEEYKRREREQYELQQEELELRKNEPMYIPEKTGAMDNAEDTDFSELISEDYDYTGE